MKQFVAPVLHPQRLSWNRYKDTEGIGTEGLVHSEPAKELTAWIGVIKKMIVAQPLKKFSTLSTGLL